ncbi:MAG: hypothetical protein WCK32_00770 [Chlorobiaceae bacterium]
MDNNQRIISTDKQYVIDGRLLIGLIQYLSKQPCSEVFDAWTALQKAPEMQVPPVTALLKEGE